MNIHELYTIFQNNPAITTDSRKIKPNSVFFALKGEKFNGNAFACQALENGANYAIIDDNKYAAGQNTILVHDTLKTLQELANYHRKKNNFKIIAITGSNGKTTTKELIYTILKKKYKCFATKGNLNNHIGVPLTLLSATSEAEIGIIEMGANHFGEIEFLCNIAEPDYGLITNIGKAHLEGFGSIENILRAKGELYKYLIKNRGEIFINNMNKALISLIPKTFPHIIKYGEASELVYGKVISNTSFLKIQLKIVNKTYELNTHLIGDYNLENITASVCIANYFNIADNEIINGIETYIPSNNRSQYIETENNNIILDAYNANPTSMAEAIKNFASYKAGKKAVILGEMMELGEFEEIEHQNIINHLCQFQFNKVFLSGKRFQNTFSKFRYFNSTIELKEYLKANRLKGYTILIKGSRINHLEELIDYL